MSVYGNNSAKPSQSGAGSLDWLSFADDLHAPPPDLFEFELDNSLASLDQSQLNLLDVLNFTNDSYTFYRDSSVLGPPSTITLSSESTYEGQSTHSESLYSFPRSPTHTESVYSNPSELQLSFTNVNLNSPAETAPQPQQIALTQQPSVFDDIDINSNSFGELPLPFINRTRDYDPSATINPNFSNVNPADYYHQIKNVNDMSTPQASQNPSVPISQLKMVFPVPNITVSMSETTSLSSTSNGGANHDDRRRYQCPTCPRAFARAYNLKTHMATHDPHRPKPFTCPHNSCGRSFSRKHDLGRHLISIHHENPQSKIGTQTGARNWCDSCGKGLVGSSMTCDCSP